MNKDLIAYGSCSAAIIACFGMCTWTLTRQAQMLVERMDVMDRRLAALQASAKRSVCADPERPKWCEAPVVASCPPGNNSAECFLDAPDPPK